MFLLFLQCTSSQAGLAPAYPTPPVVSDTARMAGLLSSRYHVSLHLPLHPLTLSCSNPAWLYYFGTCAVLILLRCWPSCATLPCHELMPARCAVATVTCTLFAPTRQTAHHLYNVILYQIWQLAAYTQHISSPQTQSTPPAAARQGAPRQQQCRRLLVLLIAC